MFTKIDNCDDAHRSNFSFSLKSLDKTGIFRGYASVFGVLDNHRDIILPGAFHESLQEKGTDIKLLWQHHADEPIGYFTRIEEDAKGLYVEGRLLLDLKRGQEALSLLKSGVLNGLSIGYTPKEHDFDRDESIRYLKTVELWEISLVTFPANAEAVITDIKQQNNADMQSAYRLNESLNKAIDVLLNA